jgi:HEAT repeat protein/beta-lactamase regulating signal transducer with metallopeptidase domain
MLSLTFPGFPGTTAFLLLLEGAVKGTLLLTLAAFVVLALRRASAAQRHLVWACALAGLATLPVMLVTLPTWSVRTPALDGIAPGFGLLATAVETRTETEVPTGQTWTQSESKSYQANEKKAEHTKQSTGVVTDTRTTPPDEASSTSWNKPIASGDTKPAGAPFPWAAAAFTLWAIVALVVLATFVAGHVLLRMLLRGARPVRDSEWHSLAKEAADRLGLTLPFALLRTDHLLVPVATGLLRPRVLLPAAADAWPLELRRAVLLHELAHVQRYDCLTQAVAQLACAIFWFHPAVWFAASRLQAERERACDDRVLAARMRATDYADHLLGMVKSLRATRLAALGGVAFARPSSLEGRLLAVLDPRRDRRGVGRRLAMAAVLGAALLVLPFAAFEPVTGGTAQANGKMQRSPAVDPNTLRPSQLVAVPDAEGSLEQRTSWARTDAGRRNASVWWIAWPIETSPSLRGNLMSDSWGIDLGLLERRGVFTLADVLEGRDQGTLDPAISTARDESQRTAIVLVRMASGSPDRLRVQSPQLPAEFHGEPLYWIEGVSHAESFAMLKRFAERARTDRLRGRFVESIGFLSKSELVTPYLTSVFQTADSPELRSGAAEGLARHPSPEGVRLLANAARTDPSPEVRRTSVEALGQFQTAEALEALLAIARSAEGNAGTRRAAFDALGEKVSDGGSPQAEPSKADEVAPPEDVARLDPSLQAEAAQKDAEKAGKHWKKDVSSDEPSKNLPVAEMEVQRQAIESLGHYPEAQSLPRLRRIAETSPNEDLRAAAVESIARLESPAALELLEEIAWKNTMSRPRWEAVELIGRKVPPEKALEKLSKVVLEHPSEDARRVAVESIGRMDSPAALDMLASIIRSSGDPDAQRQAVESLARRDEAGTEDRLFDLARTHPSIEVRRQAVESLGRRDGERISARLLEIARGKGPVDVKRQATESLGRREGADTREILLELVRQNESVDVQRQAVESLARLDVDVMADLAQIARSHPSGEIRRQAVESMTRRDPDKALPLLEQILRQQK